MPPLRHCVERGVVGWSGSGNLDGMFRHGLSCAARRMAYIPANKTSGILAYELCGSGKCAVA
jgi:hypothetical protein